MFCFYYAAAAKLLQSYLTLCDPIDGSPPGSPVPGTIQARTLEWVAISFSNAWKWKEKVKSLSCVRLLVTPWTAAHQAPPSLGFSRQEYWSGVPLPSHFLLSLTSNLTTLWMKKMLEVISTFKKFTQARFMTQDVIYSGECFMCTWEKGEFHCFWVKCPIDIN